MCSTRPTRPKTCARVRTPSGNFSLRRTRARRPYGRNTRTRSSAASPSCRSRACRNKKTRRAKRIKNIKFSLGRFRFDGSFFEEKNRTIRMRAVVRWVVGRPTEFTSQTTYSTCTKSRTEACMGSVGNVVAWSDFASDTTAAHHHF